MNKIIKAIPTEYNGIAFRSRLEAQWAVFFDTLGIKWVYEEDGYETDEGVRYRPDFYFPDFDTYAEVKGLRPGYEEEILKITDFISAVSPIKRVVILSNIPNPDMNGLPHFPGYYALIPDHHNPYQPSMRFDAGWFYFADEWPNSGRLYLSKANYRRPFIFYWNIERGSFSIESVSDDKLMNKHIPKEVWAQLVNDGEYRERYFKVMGELHEDVPVPLKCLNPQVANALRMARDYTWRAPKVKV